MKDDETAALSILLERLRVQMAEPVNFTRSDSATTAAKVRLLSAAATHSNVLAITDFDGLSHSSGMPAPLGS